MGQILKPRYFLYGEVIQDEDAPGVFLRSILFRENDDAQPKLVGAGYGESVTEANDRATTMCAALIKKDKETRMGAQLRKKDKKRGRHN